MISYIVFVSSLLIHITRAQPPLQPPTPQPIQPWKTLSGKRPLVIARGGMSGVFPDSSDLSYMMAVGVSLKDTVLFCDLQFTKDSNGFCLSDVKLDKKTNVAVVYPRGKKTYEVYGESVTGWFAVDYTAQELFPKTLLTQNVLSRTDMFDGLSSLTTLDDIFMNVPGGVWVNVQFDTFYNQHQISPLTFLENYPNLTNIQYISSPEIGFLKAINPKIDKTKTKLILKVHQPNATELTTKQTYSSILNDLDAIKEFASGILVPKEYIVPVGKDLYLMPPTQLVKDAHNAGLEVYASGFANDLPASYNYSHDPTLEYLQFIENPEFSVDGVLTDFASTASEAIACIAHYENTIQPRPGKALIITHNGASGDYAACTDLAYEKAINDGADIIDCAVQMSKDGVAFCSASADLTQSTTATTKFMSQSTSIPEVQQQPGIFSFNLEWSEIQTLTPQLTSFQPQGLPRNPAAKNKGKFVTLAEFLELSKTKAVTGILINIQNAAYLASKKGLDITNTVATALKKATFDKQSTQKVFIQSDDTSVLDVFKDTKSYRKVFAVTRNVTSIGNKAVEAIKKYADTVDISKNSLITLESFFTLRDTKFVEQMHDANISVHVCVLYNEFTTIPFDMCADPLINIATFVAGLQVDGLVTDYPATAVNYMKSPCLDANAEYQIQPTPIGGLLTATGAAQPPEAAPPALDVTDIIDPPLPQVSKQSPPKPSEGVRTSVTSLTMCIILTLMYSSLLCATT